MTGSIVVPLRVSIECVNAWEGISGNSDRSGADGPPKRISYCGPAAIELRPSVGNDTRLTCSSADTSISRTNIIHIIPHLSIPERRSQHLASKAVGVLVGASWRGMILTMSDAEIERIFRSLDRIEARLAKLEELEAMRKGQDRAASMTRGTVAMLIAAISCATGVTTAIVTHVI